MSNNPLLELRGITKRQLIVHWRKHQQHLVGEGGSAARERLAGVPEAFSEEASSVEQATESLSPSTPGPANSS